MSRITPDLILLGLPGSGDLAIPYYLTLPELLRQPALSIRTIDVTYHVEKQRGIDRAVIFCSSRINPMGHLMHHNITTTLTLGHPAATVASQPGRVATAPVLYRKGPHMWIAPTPPYRRQSLAVRPTSDPSSPSERQHLPPHTVYSSADRWGQEAFTNSQSF